MLPRDLRDALSPAVAAKRRASSTELGGDVIDACCAQLVAAMGPLVEAGKLGAVLLQFAPWLHATEYRDPYGHQTPSAETCEAPSDATNSGCADCHNVEHAIPSPSKD